MEHFSKFVNSYFLENNKAWNKLKKLKHFFAFYDEPKEFASDNGKEFINSAIQNFLEENNIINVKGNPSQPHSEGL